MSNYNAKDMFQLQSELIEVKVDMAVSKAIDRVIERIDVVRSDIHHMEKRLATTETSLNDIKKITDQVRTRLLDYGMRAVWIMIGGAGLYAASLVLRYFNFIK